MKTKIQFTSLFIIFLSHAISGHFTPAYLAFSTNPYNPMNIYVTSATIDGVDLVAGDEIGIFDGNTCVGVGIVNATITTSNLLSISTSQQDTDESTDVGFTPGNNIILRFWDSSIYKEGIVSTVTYLQGDATFSSLGSSYVSLSSLSTDLALNGPLLTENYHLQNNYPNARKIQFLRDLALLKEVKTFEGFILSFNKKLCLHRKLAQVTSTGHLGDF